MTKSDNDNDGREEKELTPDERLQWLRDRGVLIETAEERKAGQIKAVMNEVDNVGVEPITYVFIPADKAKPIEECSFVPPSSSSSYRGDPLSDHLKAAFATDSDKIDISLFQRAQQDNPLHQLGTSSDGNFSTTVSPETLQKVAEQGHCETFALVHPAPSNKFVGVNLYLDEVGQMKRLPLNPRASEFAKVAGYNPPPIFYGNVFLARVQKRGPLLEGYLPLTVQECHPQAPWLQQAATDNLEYQLQFNQLTGKQGETQPAVAGSDGVAKTEYGGKYSWTQSEEELELVVPLKTTTDGPVVNAKDVSVVFKPQKVQVSQNKELILFIDLFERIDVDGCTWTIDKGKDGANPKLVVTMEKIEEALWPRIEN